MDAMITIALNSATMLLNVILLSMGITGLEAAISVTQPFVAPCICEDIIAIADREKANGQYPTFCERYLKKARGYTSLSQD
jgi:hypothetical protein